MAPSREGFRAGLQVFTVIWQFATAPVGGDGILATWGKPVHDHIWRLKMDTKQQKIEQLLLRAIRVEEKAKWVRAGKSLAFQQVYIKESG